MDNVILSRQIRRSGSVMAKPVAGDIDDDGKLDIFVASQDVSPGGFYDDQGVIMRQMVMMVRFAG